MIRATSSGFSVTVSGIAVYLDNWAIGDLAEGDSSRRRRFVAALCTGDADLVFSVANAAELTGLQGKSREAATAFLDELGPHWFAVELDVHEVVRREISGVDRAKSCASERFFMDYCAYRLKGYAPGSEKLIDLSEVFRLGAVLDWLAPQRESIRQGSAQLGDALGKMIGRHCADCELNPLWLDQNFPRLPFNPVMPATFTYVNLVRTLVKAKARYLNGNDGMDFSHAVMGSAFASFATLDTYWKRRVECLPTPNRLAFVYSPSQLDAMVTDLELTLKRRGTLLTET